MSVKSLLTREMHTGFRLVPTSVTLNDPERRGRGIALILRYFTEFNRFGLSWSAITSEWLKIAFAALANLGYISDIIIIIIIMSAEYPLPSTFGQI